MNKTLKRELHVAIHAQSRKFRIYKYLVIFTVMGILYFYFGWGGVLRFLLYGFVAGLGVHFFFRWKTNGWRKSWWLYKRKSTI